MKTTKNGVHLIHAGDNLSLPNRVDDPGMGAPGDDDKSFILQADNQGQIISGLILLENPVFDASQT